MTEELTLKYWKGRIYDGFLPFLRFLRFRQLDQASGELGEFRRI